MSFISDFLALIAGLPRPLLVVVTGALVLAECTVGLGFVVPGESGLLIASAAVTDFGFFCTLSAAVALCAVVGDNIGYWLGRRYGFRFRETRVVRKLGQRHWDRACRLLCKYGMGAVLVARFLPVVRTLTPVAAGTSGLGYGRFLLASVIGGVAWSATHVSIGWIAGASAKYVEEMLGRASGIVVVAIGLGVLAAWWRRRARQRRVAADRVEAPAREAETEHAA
ncbi:DedA family protein [Parasphingorhabdus pacifica]